MHTRRILLAFTLAASAATAAFADLVQSPDRLEQLSKTLSQGSYNPDDLDLPASAKMNITLRSQDAPIELNNASIAKKYGSSANSASRYTANSPYSWLVTHPLPDMKRVSSDFGGRTMGGRAEHHSGLDLSAPSGTPIYATGPGIVTKSGWGTGYGQYVDFKKTTTGQGMLIGAYVEQKGENYNCWYDWQSDDTFDGEPTFWQALPNPPK